MRTTDVLSIDEYKAIFEASPDGCLVVSQQGIIRAANRRTEELFGWTADELIGQPIEVLIPKPLRVAHTDHRDRFVANPHNRPMGIGLDLKGERNDGSTFPVEVSLSPWRHDDGTVSVVCTVRDVSTYRRLRNFSEGALRATEEERKRIARELHDDTAQRLATLILRVRKLANVSEAEARQRLFDEIRAEIVAAADGVKRMSRGLRPPEIEEVGLGPAIQAHVRTLAKAGGPVIRLELGTTDPPVGVTAQLAMYRIVQEALSNARRYSGSELVEVTLVREDGHVVASVRDAGTGFALHEASEGQRGLGLIGMQERATMVGGRLVIDTAPGKGTTVRVSVPVTVREGSDG